MSGLWNFRKINYFNSSNYKLILGKWAYFQTKTKDDLNNKQDFFKEKQSI